ncbi:MAG: hypothetical protein ACOC2L_02700 [Candidatus Sumerlaeota bacterium]
MDMKKVVIVLVGGFVLLAAVMLPNRAVQYGPGVTAPVEPVQVNLETPDSFEHGDYTITRLAKFQINAKVLSRKKYRWDRGASVSPIDLALGWGPMSDEKVLEAIDISQSGRWYHWRTDAFPIPRRQIETNSANMHMIPANDQIRKRLGKVRKGQLVSIEGYLVQLKGNDGLRWKSSLTRQDTGDASCELVYVHKVAFPQP